MFTKTPISQKKSIFWQCKSCQNFLSYKMHQAAISQSLIKRIKSTAPFHTNDYHRSENVSKYAHTKIKHAHSKIGSKWSKIANVAKYKEKSWKLKLNFLLTQAHSCSSDQEFNSRERNETRIGIQIGRKYLPKMMRFEWMVFKHSTT